MKKTFSQKRVLNYFYYLCTGVRVGGLVSERDDFKNTLDVLARFSPDLNNVDVEQTTGGLSNDMDCKDLAELFASYGSDKSTKHNYHLVYAFLLKNKRYTPIRLLEIGLGTNNVNVPSNMGKKGKPGASLRAFRDWGPQFQVYGADLDESILFSDERITTYPVDQTSMASLASLAARFSHNSLDIIIDDGLHTPVANLNTIQALLTLLKPGGFLVIEDILDRYLTIWKIALAILPNGSKLVRCKSASVCIIQKR